MENNKELINSIDESQVLSLEEMQNEYYKLLIEFDKVCKKYKIRYELGGGSMLGAVRHGGFIPWDDDIDVMMPRPDYERFLYSFYKGRVSLPERRDILSIKNNTFIRHYARYISYDIGRISEYSGDDDCPFIGIDIFPVDGIYSNNVLSKIQVKRIRFLRRVLLISLSKKGKSSKGAKVALLKDIIRPFTKILGSKRIARHLEHVCGEVDFRKAKYVGVLTGMYGHKEKWLKEDYLPLEDIKFKDGYFPGYKNYDIYLSNIYGDYMALPPEDKRIPHLDKGYWINKVD